MIPTREIFLKNVCYTDLVFNRFNKKLRTNYSITEIKQMVNKIILSPETSILKQGKNYYLLNGNIELVINSFNYRLITANRK